MEISLSSNFINKILASLSKISNTPILDLALIYKKYSKNCSEISRIVADISGINKSLTINIFSILPFLLDLLRRNKYYPVAYITKSKYFYNSEFYIEKGVLIPRPESEILVDLGILFSLNKILEAEIRRNRRMESLTEIQSETNIMNHVKNLCREKNGFLYIDYERIINFKDRILTIINSFNDISNNCFISEDIEVQFCEFCSGSGAISISLIKELLSLYKKGELNIKDNVIKDQNIKESNLRNLSHRDLTIKTDCTCFDISQKAISIAKKNAKIILGKEANSIKIIKSNILKNRFLKKVEKKMFDFILANPPYISEEDFENLPNEVRKHEPKNAFLPPKEQNIFYKKIVYLSSFLLKNGGLVALEVSDSKHAKVVFKILGQSGFKAFIINDFKGIGRVVAGQRI